MLDISPLDEGQFDFNFMHNVDSRIDTVSMMEYDGEVQEAEEACFTAVATTIPIRTLKGAHSVAINRNSVYRGSVYITIDSGTNSSNNSANSSPRSRRHSWNDIGARSSNEECRDTVSVSSIGTASPPMPPHASSLAKENEIQNIPSFTISSASLAPAQPQLQSESQPAIQEPSRPLQLLPWESHLTTPSPFITLPILACDLDAPQSSPSTATTPRSTHTRQNSSISSHSILSSKSFRKPFARIVAPAFTSAATVASTPFRAPNTDHRQGKYRMVRIPREEYFMYWARDPRSGKYVGTEPEGEGLKRLRKGLVANAQTNNGGTVAPKTLSLLESRV